MELRVDLAKLRNEVKLFVATPCYGGICTTNYMRGVLDLSVMMCKLQIPMIMHFIQNESLITRARRYMADEFLRSEGTHLLFIDADIELMNAQDVLAMLALDKDIIGAPYQKKTISWEKVFRAVKTGLVDDDPNKLADYVGDYVFNPAPGINTFRLDEPVEVLDLGTGFMMIKRPVFEKFAAAFPETLFTPDHNRSAAFNGTRQINLFFQAEIDTIGNSNRYLSEDYRFTQRCRHIGVKTWMAPWVKLRHTGTYNFSGSLEALAKLGAQPAVVLSPEDQKKLEDQLAAQKKSTDTLEGDAPTPAAVATSKYLVPAEPMNRQQRRAQERRERRAQKHKHHG